MTVDSPPLPPPETTNLPIVADPPPPYPARNRRTRRQRTARRQGNASEPGPPGHQTQNGDVLGSPTSQRTRTLAADDSPQQSFLQPHYTRAGDGGDSSDYDEDRNILLSSPRISMRASQDTTYDREDDDMNNHASETTPFLTPPQRPPGRRFTGPSGIPTITTTPSGQRLIRRSSISRASTISVAPSLAQTVMSLFNTDDDCEDDFACHDDVSGSPSSGYGASWNRNENGNVGVGGRGDFDFDGGDQEDAWGDRVSIGRPKGLFNKERWRRYFRPLGKKVYYSSLFHLAVVNFPYALAAWVYLFVFTVAGTTLLMALPLGAILCFFNLLGARAFARGELALQTKFHSPLSYPAPYPPRPIFTRLREATSAEVEMGNAAAGDWVPEKSFYRNAYAMFTDPTSYQALFYFLVIKPAITLVFSLALILFVIPSMVLILPAPAALRAVRRLGVWQANVSVEGLYLAVR